MSQIKFAGIDQCLNQKCTSIDIEDLKKNQYKYVNYSNELIKKMKRKDGCGIAAPQIGDNISLAVVAIDGTVLDNIHNKSIHLKKNKPLILINPRFDPSIADKEKIDSSEGCLSIPNRIFNVKRFNSGFVEYTNISGELCRIFVVAPTSCVFQHEIDHLNGITLIEREKMN